MSLSYTDSLHLDSIETYRNTTIKENGEKISETNKEEIEEEGEMTFQGLNELIYQR